MRIHMYITLLYGTQHLAAALAGGVSDGVPPAGVFGSDGVGGVGGGTLVIAPEECLAHRTAPEPIVRGGPDAPPENVNRLHVLTHPGARLQQHGGRHCTQAVRVTITRMTFMRHCPPRSCLHMYVHPVRVPSHLRCGSLSICSIRAVSSTISHQAIWCGCMPPPICTCERL